MKKNQSGVSMITLVITIIVVIILAMVAFGSSTQTIDNANFSTFTNNVGEVNTQFQTVFTTVKGTEAQRQITRNNAQVYNFVAKGATLLDDEKVTDLISGDQTDYDLAWMPRGIANGLACTQLNPNDMEKVIGMKLPRIKVNTAAATGRECSYFVTREGTVFVWPPYEHENEYYVNADTKVIASGDTTTIKADGTEVEDMYPTGADKFEFMVGNVGITVMDTAQLSGEQKKVLGSKSTEEIAEVGTIFYTDSVAALSPVGLENDSKVESPANSGGQLTKADTNMMYNLASKGTGSATEASKLGAIVPRTADNFKASY